MARLKKLGNKTFLRDLHQIFNFDSSEEFEKKKARLFPIGKTNDENQTTSIFLSSLSAVKEYREDLLNKIGIKKINNRNIQLHVYTEIPSKSGEERPDGLIVVTSGINDPIIEWISFVESKIGNQKIDDEQIENYITFGQDLGIENIITVSNQLVSTPYETPVVRLTKKKFNLYHWSWISLSVTAGRLLKSGTIDDDDHVYILSELRRYFNTHIGIKSYEGMEKDWKEVTVEFSDKSSKGNKDIIEKIINSYKQKEKDICLQLTDGTGHYVQLKTNVKTREDLMKLSLEKNKIISSTFFINENPNKTFTLNIDFIARKITCYSRCTIEHGKSKAQTSRLINLFSNDISNEDDIFIGAIYPRRSSLNSSYKSLGELLIEKEEGNYSILNKDHGDVVKEFEIKMVDDLGVDFHKPQVIVRRLESLTKVYLLYNFNIIKSNLFF